MKLIIKILFTAFLLIGAVSGVAYAEDVIKEGTYKDFYPDGKSSQEENYQAGKKHGIQKYFYPDGKVAHEISFVQGLKQGPQKNYYPNGQAAVEFEMQSGLMEGKFQRYKTNGQPWETRFYKSDRCVDENGQAFNGPYELKYDNGNVFLKENYVDGLIEGKNFRYHENGQIDEEREYKNGKLDGILIKYDAAGKKGYEAGFRNDMHEGPARSFDESGRLIQEQMYSGDQLEGVTKIFFPNGKMSEISEYHQNLQHGPAKYFFPSGQLAGEWNFVNGKPQGEAKQYHQNGNPRVIRRFIDGEEKEVKRFYSDGPQEGSGVFDDIENKKWLLGAIWYVVFLLSLTVHEAAHAFSAFRLGDPTAYHAGQVTLDPRPHMKREPFGTVVVPVLTYVLSDWMIGWASAPYNPQWALQYPKRSALMSLAGPVSNLILVAVSFGLLWAGLTTGIFHPPESVGIAKIVEANVSGWGPFAAATLSVIFSLNLILFIFNMIPFPPLDGSGVVPLLLPHDVAQKYLVNISQPTWMFLGLFLSWKLMNVISPPVFSFLVDGLYVLAFGRI